MVLAAALALGAPQFVDLGIAVSNTAACWADVNNDGWSDLLAGENVWINKAGKSFDPRPGLGSVVAADFDNDGWTDAFSWSRLKLYRNNKGQFEELALPSLPVTVSRGACWGDFDNDGFVDLYIGGYEDWGTQTTYPSLVLMNRGGKSFELVRQEAKFRTRGVTACDFDRDGDLDVYTSNYRLQPNQLWTNDGKATFTDSAQRLGALATSEGFPGGHSIGSAWGDFDNDGELDLFAGNFAHVDSRGDQPKSRFLRNKGRGEGFEDKGTCGVFYQESYASPAAGDYDNDGRLDLYFTTVYETASFGRKNNPVLFSNAADFDFKDGTAANGLAGRGSTYQAAWADFDHDGDLDLATDGRVFVNQGTPNTHWLQVRLKGGASNASAIGAQVRIALEGKILTRHVEAGTGEGNQNDLTLHFGLGRRTQPVNIVVFWPGGKTQTVRGVRVDQIIEVGR
jgi:hypothetical protein